MRTTPTACQYGPSGHCTNGSHTTCAHRPGGPHEHGNEVPITHLTTRGRNPDPDTWTVINGHTDVWLHCRTCRRRHGHIWRCPCHCHQPGGPTRNVAAEQLDLLDVLAAVA